MLTPKSTIEGLVWPGIPSRHGQMLLTLLYQIGESQWWPSEVLRDQQLHQLEALLRHALETVPFYRARLAEVGFDANSKLTPEMWQSIPILTPLG